MQPGTAPQASDPVPRPRGALLAVAGLAAFVCAGVVTQVFLAGLGLLVDPSYLAWHGTFVHALEAAALAILVLSVVGRGGAGVIGLGVGLFLLISLQYALIHGFDGPVRALHAANAMVLFAVSWVLARQAAGLVAPPRRINTVLSATVVVLAALSIGIASAIPVADAASEATGRDDGSRTPVTQAGSELGARVYADNCSGCHGAEGRGRVGPRLAGNDSLSDRAFVLERVRDGEAIMPAFSRTLSADEISAVVDHVRTSWGNAF